MRRLSGCRRTAGAGMAAGGLASGLLVWAAIAVAACTNIMGSLGITPTSGPGGTTVITGANGLVPKATYALHFGKTSGTSCMSFSGVINLQTITADASGGWTNVSVTIPRTASMGVHSLCGMELKPVKGGSGTTHDTFTVT